MNYKVKLMLCGMLILAGTNLLFAQKFHVKWGATVSDEKQTKFNIIGADQDAVYVLRFQHAHGRTSVPFFVVLNKITMQELTSVEMQIPIPDKRMRKRCVPSAKRM